MEAIQQKVELSQQLDQWQQDMQELLEEQMNRKMVSVAFSHFLASSLTSLCVSEAATEGQEPGWGSGQRLKSEPGREEEEQAVLFPQASWIHLTRGERGGEGGGGSGGQLERELV